MDSPSRTLTGLRRWSCQDAPLPAVAKIRAIHVYDFDNTLFFSPLPNRQIWNGPSIGQLQSLESFSTGGWWHDVNILSSTGNGAQEEEKTAWHGWWNEDIVDLVRLSMQQKDAVTVLLTGRKDSAFADLVSRMVEAKGLHFDLVCLKPGVGPANQPIASTMSFKQLFLRDLVFTYSDAEEIRVYEDRPKHTKAFRDWFAALNRSLESPASAPGRSPIVADVIQVPERATTLDPVTEVCEVQRMINTHNTAVREKKVRGLKPLAIKRTVFYTGYLISPQDAERLSALAPPAQDQDWRVLANNILITPRPAPQQIVQKVGGMGHTLRWRVTHLSCFENKLWAARVAPCDPSARFHTENPTPTVVLSLSRSARPADARYISYWQPVAPEQRIEFESVVGEKVLLRIEPEQPGESADHDAPSAAAQGPAKSRKHPRDEDFPPLAGPGAAQENQPPPLQPSAMQFGNPPQQPRNQFANNNNNNNNNNRGGGGGGGGGASKNQGGRGGGNRGRGSGGRGRGGRGNGRGRNGRGGQYRSLDDNVGNYGGAGMQY